MKRLLLLLAGLSLSGCDVGTVASTAVDVVTLPALVASAGLDADTTSQSEPDEKLAREIRRQDEDRGKQSRLSWERCRKGRPLPTDDCTAFPQR